MNLFEQSLTRYLSANQLQRLRSIEVGIAGAGGLGSNCAADLVRSGFKKLVIVDFDTVEPSNLNRQYYFLDQVGLPKVSALRDNLLRINPDLDLTIFQARIEADNIGRFFDACQVVVEAFDETKYKRLLVEHYLQSSKLVVGASGIAGRRHADEIMTHKCRDRFYLIGDLTTEVSPETPPLSPKVTMSAAKQANVVLNWVLNGDSCE